MKGFIFIVLLCALNAQGRDPKSHGKNEDSEVICSVGDDDIDRFRRALYDFHMKLYRRVAVHTQGHFVISGLTIWQSLAAVAEGSNGLARQELFKVLGLPNDECERRSYYQLANSREPPGPDVSLARTRLLFVDEGLLVNNHWHNMALQQFNLVTTSVPMKRDPQQAALLIRDIIPSQTASLNLQGNSVLTDTLDYQGLWSETFPETGFTRSPFYDHNGHEIGSVDMMRIRKRVRMTFLKRVNARVVEIPVGHNERYRMLFGIPMEGHNLRKSFESITNTVIFEIVDGLKETQVPIDVAIPRFLISTESDVRGVLEELGVNNLWTDASATRNISDPPAAPSSFIQRVQVTLDSHGVGPHIPEFTEYSSTGLDPILGNEVIIDRPFMYGLFDTETYTCLFSAAFSVPTYGLHE